MQLFDSYLFLNVRFAVWLRAVPKCAQAGTISVGLKRYPLSGYKLAKSFT